MNKNHSILELEALFVRETEKAVCIKNLKEEEVWLPKSQVEVDSSNYTNGDWIELQVPQWLAEDKGLV